MLPAQITTAVCVLVASAGLIAAAQTKNISSSNISACVCAAAMVVAAALVLTWSQDLQTTGATAFWLFGILPASFRIDDFARLFLLLLSAILFAVGLFSTGYLTSFKNHINNAGRYWACFILFCASMYAVVASADAVTFLVFFEIMALTSTVLVGTNHEHRITQKSALIYLGSTRIASALLCAGFILMHHQTGSWSFADWQFISPASNLAASLIMFGFFIKSGVWPFHIWLPYAHPAAPATVSSLMSGFMIKIAIYGLIRILVFGHLSSPILIGTAFILGLISAFWGILFSLVQNDLKRLLAYSSIENIGLIVMAIALALEAEQRAIPYVATIALTAAVFHCLNHGIFKSLLFLSTGAIDASAHSRDLRLLGGLAKTMPWTAASFCLASFSICSLPPFNGFASKWLIYQGLFRYLCAASSLSDKASCLFAICVLTAVGTLVIAVYVKAYAVAFLGNPRTDLAKSTKEVSLSMISAEIFLVVILILSGMLAKPITKIISGAIHAQSSHDFFAMSYYPLPIPLSVTFILGVTMLTYFLFIKPQKAKKFITWDCGYGVQSTKAQITSDSFVQPIARIFRPILKYENLVTIEGRDRSHFPEKVRVDTKVVSHLESKIYLPCMAFFYQLSKSVTRLQAGSIHLYLFYVCVTLVLLLIFGTRV